MAVISADGIVGKVLRVYGSTSLVLLIDDQTSGVGAILDKSRLQGIVRGTPSGEVVLEKVMSDETVSPGELVLTSGGDGIFPKGLLVGRVTKVSPGSELFLNIRVRPAADLHRLEEVLVVTKIDERQAQPDQAGSERAIDILANRLPTVPPKPENTEKTETPDSSETGTAKPKVAGSGIVGSATGSDAKPKTEAAQASAGGAAIASPHSATKSATIQPKKTTSGSASPTAVARMQAPYLQPQRSPLLRPIRRRRRPIA